MSVGDDDEPWRPRLLGFIQEFDDWLGYPQTGEINLMRYYNEKKGQASFQRLIRDSRATEFDVLCLLWMSKLAF